MDEYSQRDAGEQRPPVRKPPQKKPDNSGWYSWPIIIVLFALGLWPVALILMFINIFGDEKRKKQPASQRKPSAEARMEQVVELSLIHISGPGAQKNVFLPALQRYEFHRLL